ncbi:MAG TPA: zinc ribbon domain-containing protein [Pyrinomonadaceae bacterium]|nr:zinc ribbon domain-containing protein [Pyrinomonadaceae bacterium]
MFCPNCGAKTSIDQKFCRACGLGLTKIASELTEQLPSRPDENLLSEKERLEKIGVALLSVFGAGVLGVILYGVIYKLMLTQGQFWGGLAFLGFLIMCLCGLASVIFFAKAKEVEAAAGKRKLQAAQDSATPTKELLTEGNFEPVPVPSVTDRTTELLFAEKRHQRDET